MLFSLLNFFFTIQCDFSVFITQSWSSSLTLQVLYRWWIKPVNSWKMGALLLPMPLFPHPCAARHDPPCWRASTSTTTTPTPTMRTARRLPGKLSTSHAHSPSTSTTPATGQVGEREDVHTQTLDTSGISVLVNISLMLKTLSVTPPVILYSH